MNQSQRKYALKRIKEIEEQKKKDIKFSCALKRVILSQKDKYDLIKTGKVKLRPLKYVRKSLAYSESWFDFSEYEQKDFYDTVKENKLLKSLKILVNKSSDVIMLGEELEVMTNTLKDLESFKTNV